MTPDPITVRHEPTDECDGKPLMNWLAGWERFAFCPECGVRMCSCEHNVGHDCEEETS
jgi:hypothetical protein